MRRLAVLILFLSSPLLVAQDLAADAARAFNGGEFEKAASLYKKVADADKKNGDAWFRLGYSLHMTGKIEAALVAHLEAANFPLHRALALYNAACASSLLGKKDDAFAHLGKSIDAGYIDLANFEKDSDFANVQDDPRFAQAKARLAKLNEKKVEDVGILVFEGMEARALASTADVFKAARSRTTTFATTLIGPNLKDVRTWSGLVVTPTRTIDEAKALKVLIIPGELPDDLTDDAEFKGHAKKLIDSAEVVLAIGDGAFLLARLGYLADREAVTKDSSIEALRAVEPKVKIVRRRGCIVADRFVTTPGLSAATDGALMVVAKLLGEPTADRVAVALDHERQKPEAEATED